MCITFLLSSYVIHCTLNCPQQLMESFNNKTLAKYYFVVVIVFVAAVVVVFQFKVMKNQLLYRCKKRTEFDCGEMF